MIGFLRKIKDTLFSEITPEDRAEAMIRIHFLEYLAFDVEFYGNFYKSSVDVLKRYSDLLNSSVETTSNSGVEKRVEFLEEALAEIIQLEFDSWTSLSGMNSCDCEIYYSFRGWYNFHFIAKGLLEVNSTGRDSCHNAGSKYLVIFLTNLIEIGRKDLGV
jgi:hypothetical protein